MQSNKILTRLILVWPILTISSCTSDKCNNTTREESAINASSIGMDRTNDSNTSSNEQVHLQMQEALHENIIYFDVDKYDIHATSAKILDAHGNFLRNNPSCTVTIEGHADERGTSEYNIALGERRANAVKMYLQSKGVSSDQITILSYGKEKPAVLGHDETAYAKNRRSILVY